MDIINSIISLGASVMMPVIFFIIALCFGVKIGTAFKAGMLVGIGFEGGGAGDWPAADKPGPGIAGDG